MQTTRLLFILWIVLLVLPVGCQDSDPKTGETKESSPKTRITQQINAYYQGLETEQIDPEKFFASQVERFFNAQNLSPAQVNNILQQGFEAVEERQISWDTASLQIRSQDQRWIATFSGRVSSRRAGTEEFTEATFSNRLIFNQDFQIVSYEDLAASAPTKSRGMPPAANPEQVVLGLLAALKKGDLATARESISKQGVLLLTRPGAMERLSYCSDLDQALDIAKYLTKRISAVECQSVEDQLPEFDCEGWSRQGCFLAPVESYTTARNLMNHLQETNLQSFSAQEKAQYTQMEEGVTHLFISTEGNFSLGIGREDGKWQILEIDLASYDCSA